MSDIIEQDWTYLQFFSRFVHVKVKFIIGTYP